MLFSLDNRHFITVLEKMFSVAAFDAAIGNVFEQQRRRAYYAAARSATEDAFGELNLKLVNTGYQSTKNSISDSKE